MIMVTIKAILGMSILFDTNFLNMYVKEGTSINGLLDLLEVEYGDRMVKLLNRRGSNDTFSCIHCFRNGQHVCTKEQLYLPLENGDQIYIMLPSAGG